MASLYLQKLAAQERERAFQEKKNAEKTTPTTGTPGVNSAGKGPAATSGIQSITPDWAKDIASRYQPKSVTKVSPTAAWEDKKRLEAKERRESVPAEERADWGKIAAGTAYGGLQQFTKGLSATAAMLEKPVAQAAGWVLGNDQLYQDAPFYKINQNMDKEIAAHQARMQPEYEKAGKAGDLVEKYGVPTVAAVPQAVTAFLTFGQSLAAQGTTAGLQAASAAAQSTGVAKIAGMVADGLKNTAANPQFWLSFLSTAGPEYEQAKADGADDAKAYAYAALSGALNSLVEVGGGIDKLPDVSKNALKEWAGSMIDEGKEEVVQGMISQALQRGMYGKNNPLASLTDENAIFSLRRGFGELAGGAVVGGILGGAQIGVQRALTGPQKTFSDAVQEQIMGNRPRSAEEAAQEAAQVQAQRDAQDIPQAQKNAATGVEISDRAKKQLSRADRRTLQNLSQITGSNIQFVPRAQLEQMARPGAEGMQLGGQIYISEDAARPYMEIAKHEITHRLQQTAPENYAKLRDRVAELYRGKGVLDSYLKGVMADHARGVEISEEAALDEITANYAEDLMWDEKAVRELAGEDRGLLTRMLDALRDFIAKVKTALGGKGNAETAELEQSAAMWQAALEESAKNSGVEGDGEARYSIAYDRDNRPFVSVEEDILEGVPQEDWVRTVKDNLRKKFPNGVTVGNSQIEISGKSRNELTRSRYTSVLAAEDPTVYGDKMRSTNNIDEILQTSDGYAEEPLKHGRRDDITSFERGNVRIRVGGRDYTAEVVIGKRKNGGSLLYDILNLQRTSINDRSKSALSGPPDGGYPKKGGLASEDTLAQFPPSVKPPQTFSEEIARQLGGGDQRLATQEGAELKRQIEALSRQNQRLREQMKRTTGSEMDEKSVRQLSRSILKDYNSSYAVADLSSRVGELYKKIAEQTISDTDARAEARAIAGDILDGSQTELNPLYEEYSELRKELRTRGISIAPEYRVDLDGGYAETRKRMMGMLKLTENGASVDQVYDDLSQRYPELFPEDIYNPADQMNRIIDVAGELQSVMGSAFEGAEADRAADFLAGDIMERFYDTPERAPTFADRQERRLQNQRVKDRARLERAVERERGRTERAKDRLQAQKAEDRQKLMEAVTRERGRKNDALQAMKERHKAANKRRSENLSAAQRREQIIRHSKKLGERLLRPTDKQHIPEELRGAAVSLLRSINSESGYSIGEDGGRIKTGTGEEGKVTKRTQAARELQAQYAKIASEESLVVDPDLAGYLNEISGFGDTPLGNLSRNQLETIWNAVKAVEASVSQADKVLGQSRYRTVSQLAETIRADNRTKKDRRTFANPVLRVADSLLNVEMMTPETFLHKLGEGGEEVFRSMRKAADRQTVILKEGVDRAKALVEETGVDLNKAAKELHSFQTEGGDSLDLTTAQIMELYALSKREQAIDHIYKGGIKPSGAKKGFFQADKAAPVRVTAADVSEMVGALTAEQRRLVDGLQAYLSTDLAAYGNDASMDAYGYKKFKETFYWPIHVDKNQTYTDPNADPVSTATRTVSGYGMAKNVTPNANNAVVLGNVLDTFTNHLNEMSTYAAWLGTSEDLNRLVNYRFRDGKGNVDGTFKTLLEQVYGKGGQTYLGRLLTDIAAGTKAGAERGLTDSLFNTWKAAKVGGNLRVVLQQPTAILRAANMISPKYFAQAKSPMKGWEKAVKYSPIAQWKDWGYFELDTGRSLKELIAGTDKTVDKAKNAMMSPAGWADIVAWGHLWNAVEAETAEKFPSLKRGSGAFYEKAAERFGEVIDRTQVVDSVLHRTQIMRSSNAAHRMATSFMSEPSKIYNMFYRDLWDFAQTDKGQRKEAGKAIARSAAALIASFAVNAIAQSLPDAWRDKDREDGFKERFSDAWVGNFLDNFYPIGYVPYLKDIESIIQGYDVSRSDMEGITKIVEAGKDLYKAVNGESKKTVLASGIDTVARLLDLLGLPAYNIKRDVYSALQHILIDVGAEELLYELDKLMSNPEKDSKTFYDDLFRVMGRDYGQYKSVYQDMIEQSWTSGDKLKTAMENRMAKDLGLDKASSLPVEYSAPGGGSFDQEVRRQLERGGSWKDALPKDSGDLAEALEGLEPEDGEDSVTKRQRIREIGDSPFSDEAKELSVKRLLGAKELERYNAARKSGISVGAWCKLYVDIANAREVRTGKTGTASKQDVALALDSVSLTDKQKDAVWESYGWESDWQNSIAGKDLSVSTRKKVAGILNALKPKSGEKDVTDQQKQEAIAKSSLSEKDKLGALETVMGEGERKKLNAAYNQGVSPVDYVAAKAKMVEYDENENDSVSQDEAKKALKAMDGLTNEEKAALWQIQNKTWKPENNPFDRKTAKAVYAALNPEEDE